MIKKKKFHSLVRLKLVVVHLKTRDKKAWELIKQTGSNKFKEGDANNF